jgi:hypothetical protein
MRPWPGIRHGAATTRLCTKSGQIVIEQAESPLSRLGHFSSAHFGICHFSRGRRVRASQAFAYLRGGGVANKGAPVKGFPTTQEVEKADKEQLARWYRFLPSGETAADQKIMKWITERFEKLGGMTAGLSKKIGM